MCGFTISNQKNIEISNLLKCRGPDNFTKIEFDDISFNFARLKIRDLSDKSNQPLVNDRYIVSFNGEILNIEYLKKQFKITLNGFWINMNMKNHFNIEHMHYNYQNKFSGIWYVQCGKGSGNLVFKGRDDFVPVSQLDQYFDDDFTNEYEIEPKPNDFILFPSYLKHWVKPNLTETPRISVAFDIGFIDV